MLWQSEYVFGPQMIKDISNLLCLLGVVFLTMFFVSSRNLGFANDDAIAKRRAHVSNVFHSLMILSFGIAFLLEYWTNRLNYIGLLVGVIMTMFGGAHLVFLCRKFYK